MTSLGLLRSGAIEAIAEKQDQIEQIHQSIVVGEDTRAMEDELRR